MFASTSRVKMETKHKDQETLREFLEEAELMHYFELFRDILKVGKLSQLKYVAVEDLAQIGLSKPEQRRYRKIYTKRYPNSYISRLKKFLHGNKKHDIAHTSSNGREPAALASNELVPVDHTPARIPMKHIIPIEDITINKELGMGQFGVVQQGTWSTGKHKVQVAIKCLGNERLSSNSAEFLKEAAVMHSIDHKNIVRLYGVVLHMDSLMLVTELAPLRSLLECLREVTIRCNFPVPTLCDFAEQICEGMIYLEHKRLIHRDLAARNILVFNRYKVKISDFGLSRVLSVGKDYYQTNYNVNLKLPVAWCAPECILYLRFTSASDVWAYGVCLWEMFTYGFQPWVALSGQQILDAIDTPKFQRLERPECCPEAYYRLMLECWSHEPKERPKFKQILPRLNSIRPTEVQATKDYKKPEDGRRTHFLEFKTGQIIAVLGKENFTRSAMWFGVLPGGACGLFDPNLTKPYTKPEKSSFLPGTLSHLTRSSTRSVRSSLLRTDLKRHTFSSKRVIELSMISSPQGDVKHTGHVGLDGACFGDISFLDTTGNPLRKASMLRKSAQDLEEVPLLNPNSPSHSTAATCTPPYPMLSPAKEPMTVEMEASKVDIKGKKLKKSKKAEAEPEPSTSKGIVNARSSTNGHANNNVAEVSAQDEEHEYCEISDTDVENLAVEMVSAEVGAASTSLETDFSKSLLHEMETILKNLDERRKEEFQTHTQPQPEIEPAPRSHTLNKTDKKKGFHTGTMKPMSSHDKKTLDTAVAMANEITTKSMNDLDTEPKPVVTPNEKSKFHFKFPLVSSLHHLTQHDAEKDNTGGKQERRNFSDEAKSVPDIQETLTEESKQAYASLIEQPTPSTSFINQINQETPAKAVQQKPSTIPKPAPRAHDSGHFHSLQKQPTRVPHKPRFPSPPQEQNPDDENEIPLPPKSSKPKLVDKPRHFRKYPLREPVIDTVDAPEIHPKPEKKPTNIYQNTKSYTIRRADRDEECAGTSAAGGSKKKEQTFVPYPFEPGEQLETSHQFSCYLGRRDLEYDEDGPIFEEVELRKGKDHVSVEDLLEFADQKPSSKQRGIESDEVRIMNKVLKKEVSSERCLEALELCDWNIHTAIKVLKMRMAVAGKVVVNDEECKRELLLYNGDVAKASSLLIYMKLKEKKQNKK